MWKRVRQSVSETCLRSCICLLDIAFEIMAFELWAGETSIIEVRTVLFTWIRTTQQTTTKNTPTSEMGSILKEPLDILASRSADRIHSILKESETRSLSNTQEIRDAIVIQYSRNRRRDRYSIVGNHRCLSRSQLKVRAFFHTRSIFNTQGIVGD